MRWILAAVLAASSVASQAAPTPVTFNGIPQPITGTLDVGGSTLAVTNVSGQSLNVAIQNNASVRVTAAIPAGDNTIGRVIISTAQVVNFTVVPSSCATRMQGRIAISSFTPTLLVAADATRCSNFTYVNESSTPIWAGGTAGVTCSTCTTTHPGGTSWWMEGTSVYTGDYFAIAAAAGAVVSFEGLKK